MFLNRLSAEEKSAFLELAYHVAGKDGNFSAEEKGIIVHYCAEMQIDDIDYDESRFKLDETLKKFTSSKSQKIALLELMALVHVDSVVHDEEKNIIEIMSSTFGLAEGIATVFSEWTKAVLALYAQGEAFLEL